MDVNPVLKTIWKNTCQFLSKKTGRELMLFFFFLFVSGCFWMIQALNETCEVHLQVPIRIGDKPGDVIILTNPPKEVTVSIQDKGLSLWRLLINPRMDEVVFKFNDICGQKTADHVRIPAQQLWDSIQSHLPSTTKFISMIAPDSVTLDYNRGQNCMVPISFVGHIRAAEQYSLKGFHLEPDSIKVYASDERLAKMDSIYVGASVSIEGLRKSGVTYVDMKAPEGVSYAPARVSLVYDIVPLVKKSIRVPVKQQNFPGGKDLRTFPSHVNVSYWVRQGEASAITPDSFYISVTYDEVLKSKDKLHPRLHSKPSTVSGVSLSPTEVDFVIEDVDDDE